MPGASEQSIAGLEGPSQDTSGHQLQSFRSISIKPLLFQMLIFLKTRRLPELTFENLELCHKSPHCWLLSLLFIPCSKNIIHIRSVFVLVLRYLSSLTYQHTLPYLEPVQQLPLTNGTIIFLFPLTGFTYLPDVPVTCNAQYFSSEI